MIQKAFITQSGTVVPWSSPRLVEQDLITCRALVSIFSDLLPSTARSTGMVTPQDSARVMYLLTIPLYKSSLRPIDRLILHQGGDATLA